MTRSNTKLPFFIFWVVLIFAGLSFTPVFASSQGDELAFQIQGSNVYVQPQAQISSAGQISSDLDGSRTAVVVISDTSHKNLADEILKKSPDYDTVVVAIAKENNFQVASRSQVLEAKITKELNSPKNETLEDAILSNMNLITTPMTRTAQVENTDAGGPSAGQVWLTGGSILLILALAPVVYNKIKYPTSRKARKEIIYSDFPNDFKRILEEYKNTLHLHKNSANPSLAVQLEEIFYNIQELFRRIDKKGTEQQKQLAAISYADTFTKLNKALGEDYYLDIVAHPSLWSRPTERIEEVKRAVSSTQQQIIENIKEVNSSQDLNLTVALEKLTRAINNPTIDDVFTK